MPSFECSTLSGSGVPALTAALSQIASPFSISGLPSAPMRRFSSFEEPGTSVGGDVVSSTNQTRTALGLTSGTPIGSDPDWRVFANMRTRALTLMLSTTPVALRNHGRPCSVILTSIILAAHGWPSTTVVSTGSPAAVWRGQRRELISQLDLGRRRSADLRVARLAVLLDARGDLRVDARVAREAQVAGGGQDRGVGLRLQVPAVLEPVAHVDHESGEADEHGHAQGDDEQHAAALVARGTEDVAQAAHVTRTPPT